jgi:uncharacterized protein (TIGR03083 family)
MTSLSRSETTEALAAEYAALRGVISSLDEAQLEEASGCRGWTNADLIFHMLLDAQRALVAFNMPGDPPPDRDYVDYWKAWSAADPDAHAHARFVRISAAAHGDPKLICKRWLLTSEAAMSCCRGAEPDYIATQGHVLTVGDFIATLVVEAAIHHLDLVRNLEEKPGPAPAAVQVTTKTLDGLLDAPRPSQWDDISYLSKGTGRQPLTDGDRSVLGDRADRFPLFS